MQKNLILVLNCGSSSIKFAIINPKTEQLFLSGLVQCIETKDSSIDWRFYGTDKQTKSIPHLHYANAINEIVNIIKKDNSLFDNIIGIGHRVVHGGERFFHSAIIDNHVLTDIKNCIKLAPLHNPAHVTGIETARTIFPNITQVAVFDTAFHQTMPKHAYIYAIPYNLYQNYGIRRYGFHGTSHRYVAEKAAKIIDKPFTQCAFISAHLGNGCSVTAVKNGTSVDTSMGLTPLEGLVMGTRSGDIDPSIPEFLQKILGYDIERTTKMLNKESGLLGITEKYSDMRSISQLAEQHDERALLALDIFCYRLAKYIMALTVPLGRLDALIFTGGIGENAADVREKVINLLQILNFQIDINHNLSNGKNNNGIITLPNSPLAIVVPTNEELMIAEDTLNLITKSE